MSISQLLAELQKTYIASIPDKISTIRKHWETKKIDMVEDEFHKIKGTGKTYGLPEVSVLGEAMEKISEKSPQSLETYLPLAIACLQTIFDLRSAGATPDLEAMPDYIKIRKLRETI
jgi:HPt (histidine-containing phosphotransfer) domain-containing protein